MKVTRLTISAILILTIFSSCKFFKKEFKTPLNSIDSVLTEAKEILEEPDTAIIETIEEITEPVELNEPQTGYGNDRFYMVVGSFLSEQLAQKYAKKMLDMGYQPQVIYSSSLGFYRVSAQSYDDYTVAVNDIANFRNNVTPRAWVHVKK